MKTLKLLVTSIILFSFFISTAQTVPANNNRIIPQWGVPVTTERYYYLPDIKTYYDIPSRQYVHLRNGQWVRSSTVPTAYRNYDFKKGRKVVIKDYRGNAPYTYYNVHRTKYVPVSRRADVNVNVPEKKYHKHGKGKGHGNAYGHTKGKGHQPGHSKGKGHDKHNH
jgi:hypothetical protein